MIIKIWTSLTMALIVSFCSGQPQDDMMEEEMPMSIMPGKCPVLNETMHQRGDTLDLGRVKGLWKLIYESKDRSDSLDCISMKIEHNIEGGNSSQVQVFFGYKIPMPQEDPKTKEQKNFILFEDGYITFNHPEQSNIGAAHKSLEELEQKNGADDAPDGKNADPYKQYFHILDTDYDNFMIFYSCHEEGEMVNQYGQTQEDVDELKLMDDGQTYDMEFTQERIMHQIFARVLVRSLKSEVTTKVKIEHWIQLLKSIVGKPPAEAIDMDYFENYKIIEHYPYCPDESVDMFKLPEARKYEELMKEMYGDQQGDDMDESAATIDDYIEGIENTVLDSEEGIGQEERDDGDL